MDKETRKFLRKTAPIVLSAVHTLSFLAVICFFFFLLLGATLFCMYRLNTALNEVEELRTRIEAQEKELNEMRAVLEKLLESKKEEGKNQKFTKMKDLVDHFLDRVLQPEEGIPWRESFPGVEKKEKII